MTEISLLIIIYMSTMQLEWQEHCLSSEKLISMLKERLEAIRKELREQDVLKEDLHADLQVVQEDLKTFKIESKQDQCKISEVKNF